MLINGTSLLIFGSRTLSGTPVEDAIDRAVTGSDYQYLITALEPKGVCATVREYVRQRQNGITLISVSLNYARAAGMHEARSVTALKMADRMLAIWDGKSQGTRNEIAMAKKKNVPCEVVCLEPLNKPTVTIDSFFEGNLSSFFELP